MSYDFKLQGGDWSIGPDGDLEKVEDSDKLIQDLLKLLLTQLGSNKLYPWYGSPISGSLIGSPYDIEFISSIAINQLQNSIDMLQKLQTEQTKYQKVTAAEQIAATKNIDIQRSPEDPRYFLVILEILTRALTIASTEFTINPYI
jgi:phage baseplate assembly protein W